MTDSLEKIEKKLAEHDDKFANQYEATKDLIRRVSELERKLSNLEKQRAALRPSLGRKRKGLLPASPRRVA